MTNREICGDCEGAPVASDGSICPTCDGAVMIRKRRPHYVLHVAPGNDFTPPLWWATASHEYNNIVRVSRNSGTVCNDVARDVASRLSHPVSA
jgi:DnaJ-class molecular chaperone